MILMKMGTVCKSCNLSISVDMTKKKTLMFQYLKERANMVNCVGKKCVQQLSNRRAPAATALRLQVTEF